MTEKSSLFYLTKDFDWINEEEMMKNQDIEWKHKIECFLYNVHGISPDRHTLRYDVRNNIVSSVDNKFVRIKLPKCFKRIVK